MTQQEIDAIADAVQARIGRNCVPDEQHYQDHLFVCSFRESAERVQSAACKTMTSTLVVGVFGFIVWAFRHWIADVFGGK